MFDNRLKALREEKGLSQKEVAAALGLPPTTYGGYENNKREPNSEILIAIADYFQCSIDYLIGKTSARELLHSISPIEYKPNSMIPIPVVGKVAAGYNCLAETNIEYYELVDSETINSGYEYIWLKVKGDSMEPEIKEDDLVLVRLQDTIDNGDYAVIIVDNEDGLVKKIKREKNSIALISINPYYPPRMFKGIEMQRINIVGKVIESKRKF